MAFPDWDLLSVLTPDFSSIFMNETTGPEVLKPFSCSIQLSMKFKLLINEKIARIRDIFMRKPTFWFLTWSDTNQAVQLQKTARGLKFRIKKVEGLYYLCSENKGAGQLRG